MNKKLVGVCGRFAVTAFALIIVVLPSAGRASTQSGAVHTFAVQADTYVSANAPSKSYGSQPSLKVDRTPKIAYLRFAVGGIAGPVSGATLRLYAQRSNSTGFDVRGVTNNSWSESSLNYTTAPPAAQQVAGSSGRLTGSAWTSIDVSSLVSGNGTYSFALESSSSSSIVLASKERGPATAAQLVITEATATSADTTPPSAPTNLTASGPTTNSISLSWSASTDDTGIAGYRVYRDGTFVTSTAQTSASVSGLSCGTSYGFAVEAYDAADNVSQRTSKSASTSACPDTTAPSAPTSLVKAGSTTSSVLMSWAASTDNVGVAGYTVYVDGTRVGNTTTSYNFTGLACGMSYTFGVEAYDAAGNVSPRTTTSASTSPCPSGSRTYYVDSVGGSDLNAGTSDTSAWKTLAKPNAASLAPGDRLLFKRGDVWTGSLKITASGNSASPITVGAYGTGNLPVIQGPATSCVVLAGSYLTVSGVQADGCTWAGVEITGTGDRVEQSVLSHNVAGVDVKSGSVGAKVLDNQIVDNNKMSVLTSSPNNDDSGAFGVLLNGDGAEVAYNRISGSDAFSYDYGRDGAAVEVYGGQGNNVHHNVGVDNHDFSELGNPRSADNTFAYNLVRSSLAGSTFLVTRGGASSLGPVTHTRVYNNTVYLSGSSSQGFVCYAGCSPDILTLRDNIIQAVWKVGYADAPLDENNDLFFGGILQFSKGANSIVADPRFVDPASQNFHLLSTSPAVDRGVNDGYGFDLDHDPVPTDGNGDGVAMPDDGSYELPAGSSSSTDTTSPTQPSNLNVTSVTALGVTVAWTASTDNVGVTGYKVYRNGVLDGSTSQTSYSFSGLSCGTSYTIAVEADDAAGNSSPLASLTVATSPCTDTTPPTAPLLVSVSGANATSITVSWGASTDNTGVAGYDVYRNGALVGPTQLTTYTFTGLTCGTSYTLAVDAYDAAGNRSTKSSLTASTPPCVDATPPAVPSNLSATGATVSSLTLSWSPSTDNVGVAGYTVYVNGAKVGNPTGTSYTFSGLSCGTGYTFGVEAYDAAGNISGRASLTAATSACPSLPPPPPPGSPCGTAATPPTSWQHVVWVVFENKQYSQIIGSPNAPYINSVANKCGLATNFYAEAHPSLPNYIAMTSGSTQGITDDSGPSSHPLSVPSIFSQLGAGWKSLQEDMPSNCYLSNSGNYAVRHNPAVYYTNIASQCAAQDVPLGTTPDLSARFTFITPNLCNDMHSCPSQSDVATETKTGDTWLSTFLPKLLSSSQYTAGNTVIFVTWDEDDYSSSNANRIATIVLSPSTPAGAKVSTRYDHYSMLRTTEELLGLPFIGNASGAGSMAADFHLR